MASDKSAVARELGCRADRLGFLDDLDEQALQQLAADLQQARRAHHEHIVASLEQALTHVPRVLRGPMRKMFGV